MDLKIFSWNCRGLSNPHTMDHIQDIMKNKRPNFLCLVETKTTTPRTLYFCAILNHCWDWVVIPSNGLSGRILVIWNLLVGNVTAVVVSRLVLHLVLSSSNKTWAFLCNLQLIGSL